ncbi:MAG: caspase family protein [Alphaproteobacteria bacterium]
MIVTLWRVLFAFVFPALIVVSLARPAVGAPEAARYALVIGNGAYTEQPLDNPVNDANLVADTLTTLGFKVFRHIDLSQKGMRRAIRDFGDELAKAGEDTVSLIFYAGHGLQVDGENFLVPVDARIKAERDVSVEAVSTSAMLDMLAYSRTSLNIVILDACRNNPYQRGFRSAAGRGLARMDAPSGTILAYATAPGQIAADGDGRNSPYTRALVRSMSQPGAPIEEVFKRVRIEVMDRSNGQQVPWESSSLTGNFYFTEDGTAQSSDTAAASAGNAETVFWTSIVTETDPALFQSYLESYPDGVFAPIARARIDALSAPAKQVATDRVASTGTTVLTGKDMRFLPGQYKLEPIASESECNEIRFDTTEVEEKRAKGYWRHPQTGGQISYKIEDGIVSVDFKGSMIHSVKDTVQIKGRDLFVRLQVNYSGGTCKVAYYLRGIMAAK